MFYRFYYSMVQVLLLFLNNNTWQWHLAFYYSLISKGEVDFCIKVIACNMPNSTEQDPLTAFPQVHK